MGKIVILTFSGKIPENLESKGNGTCVAVMEREGEKKEMIRPIRGEGKEGK